MMKISFSEELCVNLDKAELAKLLGADEGFEVMKVEDHGDEVRIVLVREQDVEQISLQAAREQQRDKERKSFL
jgi:hypothetical protein